MSAATLRIVRSSSGAKTHRLDERYVVLGQALCGVKVDRAPVAARLGAQDCTRCLELAGER